MHLYLTDYRSLYVGHVAEITSDDPRESEDGADTVPAFYDEAEFKCDCWFRLFDIRRVVSDDTVAVVDELKKLRNTRYNDRPVSLYGGMVELPLIVTRADGARYFEQDVRDKLIDGRFWVEFDADRTGIGELERDLRENVVGEKAWNALDPAARTFVATAESLFRVHRRDAGFDFSAVVIDLAKAVELQTNILLRHALRDAPVADRRVNVDGRSVDLAAGELWPLGVLARLVGPRRASESHAKATFRHRRRMVYGQPSAGTKGSIGTQESRSTFANGVGRRRIALARSGSGDRAARTVGRVAAREGEIGTSRPARRQSGKAVARPGSRARWR